MTGGTRGELILSSTSDQLDELQKRFRLLDGDRTAYYETSQYTIRQNKEQIAQLKKDNTDMSFGDLSRTCGQMWKDLPLEEKMTYGHVQK